MGEAGEIAKAFVGDEKVKLEWNAPRENRPKQQVKLVLRGENLADTRTITRNQGGSQDLGAPRTFWAGFRIKKSSKRPIQGNWRSVLAEKCEIWSILRPTTRFSRTCP